MEQDSFRTSKDKIKKRRRGDDRKNKRDRNAHNKRRNNG